MANKMKVAEKFSAIKAMLNGESVSGFSVENAVEFINERIAMVEKKNAQSGERKPTKTQLENEGVKEQILAVLATAEKPMTNGEITKAIGSEQPNKVSQLVAQMLVERKGEINPEGKIVRTEVKGRAYFALANKE